MGAVGKFADWAALLYEDFRTITVINAASMADKHPVYAFDSTQLHLRRYFSSDQKITAHSTMNPTLPYFAVRLHWIDAASDNRSQHVGDPKYADVANLGNSIRIDGWVSVIRNDTWDGVEATPIKPF